MRSSSSMTTTVAFIALLLFRRLGRRRLDRKREGDAERGSPGRVVLHRHDAAMVAHDLERDGEPEPGAHRARGEEGIEDLLHVLLGDSLTGVRERHIDVVLA